MSDETKPETPAKDTTDELVQRLQWHFAESARLRQELRDSGVKPPREPKTHGPLWVSAKDKSIAQTFSYRRGFSDGAAAALRAFILGATLEQLRTWAQRIEAWRSADSTFRSRPPRVWESEAGPDKAPSPPPSPLAPVRAEHSPAGTPPAGDGGP